MKTFVIFIVVIATVLFNSTAYGQIVPCGTPDPSQVVYAEPRDSITNNNR